MTLLTVCLTMLKESSWLHVFCAPLCSGLIIHEGSSVYRIFKRWQAVNQQWKVLNYEKAKDLGDPLSSSTKAGARGARSSTHGLSSMGRGRRPGRRLRTILNHHCGYTILHILSQLRPSDPRLRATANREVVMRVTTVWGCEGLTWGTGLRNPERCPANSPCGHCGVKQCWNLLQATVETSDMYTDKHKHTHT